MANAVILAGPIHDALIVALSTNQARTRLSDKPELHHNVEPSAYIGARHAHAFLMKYSRHCVLPILVAAGRQSFHLLNAAHFSGIARKGRTPIHKKREQT